MQHASVTEAHALQQQGYTYVDVRSTHEFADGHPAGAVNVPLVEPDPTWARCCRTRISRA